MGAALARGRGQEREVATRVRRRHRGQVLAGCSRTGPGPHHGKRSSDADGQRDRTEEPTIRTEDVEPAAGFTTDQLSLHHSLPFGEVKNARMNGLVEGIRSA